MRHIFLVRVKGKGKGKKLVEADELTQQTVPESPSACHRFRPVISAHSAVKMSVMSGTWNDNLNSSSNNDTHGGGAGLCAWPGDNGTELVSRYPYYICPIETGFVHTVLAMSHSTQDSK